MFNTNSKTAASLTILLIYLIALLPLYWLFPLLPFENTMVNVLIADVVATVIVFIFSIIFSNSSVYDPYWSVAPPIIVIYLISIFPEGNSVRQWVILSLILFWSFRLTINWLRGWQGFKHQDWRYTNIADKTGVFYWPVSFLGIHLMPTIFVFLGCLPLWFSLSSAAPINLYDYAAILFTLAAIIVEWIADEQLIKFRKSGSKERFMQSGLWSISRHPNYFGEISFWVGMFLFVVSASNFKSTTGYWTAIGFLSMIILFKFISIPMMEKRNITRKAGYKDYIKMVPALFPRILKKG
jgi:steroid 5-alpha reductase family enzyme